LQGKQHRSSEKQKEREPAPERKPYHKPELVRHGTVAEVTKFGGNFNPDAAIYAS
jgi:hypothetical protein